MNYCAPQDLMDRYGELEIIQLTDRTNTGSINTTVLNQAINDATAEINGYITAYLPTSVIPDNLVRLACDITRYYLFADSPIPQAAVRYDNAIAYLKLVRKGVASLAPDATGVVAEVQLVSVQVASAPAIFGRGC